MKGHGFSRADRLRGMSRNEKELRGGATVSLVHLLNNLSCRAVRSRASCGEDTEESAFPARATNRSALTAKPSDNISVARRSITANSGLVLVPLHRPRIHPRPHPPRRHRTRTLRPAQHIRVSTLVVDSQQRRPRRIRQLANCRVLRKRARLQPRRSATNFDQRASKAQLSTDSRFRAKPVVLSTDPSTNTSPSPPRHDAQNVPERYKPKPVR